MNTSESMNESGVAGFSIIMQKRYKMIDVLSADFDEVALKFRAMKSIGAIDSVSDAKMQQLFVLITLCRSETIFDGKVCDATIQSAMILTNTMSMTLAGMLSAFCENNGIIPQNVEDIQCVCGNCPDFDKSNIN